MPTETWVNNGVTVLTAGISATATTLTVGSAGVLPAVGQYRLVIDSEYLLVTGGQGTATLTVVRGVEGSVAATHASGATVAQVWTARQLHQLRPNLLVNGGFERWQRTGPFTVSGSYTSDRWVVILIGTSTVSIAKDTTNQDTGSAACAAVTYTQGTANSQYQQKLEDISQLQGQVASLSFRVKCSTASAVRPWVYDGTTTTFGAYHSGGGSYETLRFEGWAIPSNATTVLIGLNLEATTTVYVDNAVFNFGNWAADYTPLTPDAEWFRAQRYYQKIQGSVRFTSSGANQWYQQALSWISQPAVTPSVTVSTTGAASLNIASGSPQILNITNNGFDFAVQAAAAGDSYSVQNTVIIEANP